MTGFFFYNTPIPLSFPLNHWIRYLFISKFLLKFIPFQILFIKFYHLLISYIR